MHVVRLDLSWPGRSQSLYLMRPVCQLVPRDASLAPASNFPECRGDLKKDDSVFGDHSVTPCESKFVHALVLLEIVRDHA